MPILSGDVKLLKSANMADVAEGGGAPTGLQIADGVSNSIFPDISEMDRAGGRVNLRKTFVGIHSDDTDTYFGANVIVAEPPDDPRVNVAIFTTNQTFDVRSESASRVSSYLNAGPEISGLLLENHIVGQRSIQILQRATEAPPSVGRTLLLRQDEGQSTGIEQFVRITRVTVEQRSFTYTISGGAGYSDFDANVVTCDLSDALRFDFKGTSANRNFTRDTAASKIRDTVVADAATYCGAVPLAAQAEIGDVYARVASVYTQLVPAAQSENPLVDQYHSGSFTNVLATTPRLVSVGGSPMSMRIKVQQENRGYNYVAILKPLPTKGSLRVVYRALGNTYSIADDGNGNLTGNGSGTVNYATGSVSVTLQAMPDDRSAVVFYWGPNQAFTDRSGQAGFRPPIVQLKLDHTFIEKGSVSVRWVSGGAVKTATDDGKGAFTGDATGGISYVSGDLFLEPTAFPDAGAEYQIEYEWSALVEEAKPNLVPDASGFINLTLAQEPVPGSVVVSWATTRTVTTTSGSNSSAAETSKNSSVGYTSNQAWRKSYFAEVYQPNPIFTQATAA